MPVPQQCLSAFMAERALPSGVLGPRFSGGPRVRTTSGVRLVAKGSGWWAANRRE